MNEKLQKAFSQVRSEADLKEHTRTYLAQQTKGWTKQKTAMPYVKYALIGAVVILMMLVLLGFLTEVNFLKKSSMCWEFIIEILLIQLLWM